MKHREVRGQCGIENWALNLAIDRLETLSRTELFQWPGEGEPYSSGFKRERGVELQTEIRQSSLKSSRVKRAGKHVGFREDSPLLPAPSFPFLS